MDVFLVILMLTNGEVDILSAVKQPSFDFCLETLARAPDDIRPSLRCTTDEFTVAQTTAPHPSLNSAAKAWGFTSKGLIGRCMDKTNLPRTNMAALINACTQ